MAYIILSLSLLLSYSIFISANESQNVIVGAEQFSEYLPLIKNKRVGLLVNQTSQVGHQHLVDSLIEKQINVSAIFAPEHGFRGKQGAGETILDGRDIKTGIDIFSLHGKYKKPQKKQLEQIDFLIFDIQDVGVRYYTYISSMHYFMEACAENNIPMIVLDRPNPNGHYIDGPVLDLNYQSFIGMHPIPVVHGLTVGELATMINGEEWLIDGKQCDLTVIKVKNYDHNTHYSLSIKPSPNLPNDLSVQLYPSLGFFEGTSISVGRGTDWPFQVLGYPDKKMGGFSFRPKQITGSWKELNYAESSLYGERFTVAESGKLSLSYLINWREKFKRHNLTLISRPGFFDKLAGSDSLRNKIQSGMSAEEIENSWLPELDKYQQIRKKYLLYSDSDLIK